MLVPARSSITGRILNVGEYFNFFSKSMQVLHSRHMSRRRKLFNVAFWIILENFFEETNCAWQIINARLSLWF